MEWPNLKVCIVYLWVHLWTFLPEQKKLHKMNSAITVFVSLCDLCILYKHCQLQLTMTQDRWGRNCALWGVWLQTEIQCELLGLDSYKAFPGRPHSGYFMFSCILLLYFLHLKCVFKAYIIIILLLCWKIIFLTSF